SARISSRAVGIGLLLASVPAPVTGTTAGEGCTTGHESGRPARVAGRPRWVSLPVLAVPPALAALAVVAAELMAGGGVFHARLVELRRVLDLVLRAVHVHPLVVRIDAIDDAGREHHLLAEDPRSGVDDDRARPGLGRRAVDLADGAVDGLDLVADDVTRAQFRADVALECPDLVRAHDTLLRAGSRVLPGPRGGTHGRGDCRGAIRRQAVRGPKRRRRAAPSNAIRPTTRNFPFAMIRAIRPVLAAA